MDEPLPPQGSQPASTPPPGAEPLKPQPPVTPPPFLTPPPVMAAPPPPSRPRTSRTWMVIALVAIVVLAFSLFANLSHFARSIVPSEGRVGVYDHERQLEEVYLEHKNTSDKIAVIEVDGIITGDIGRDGMGMVEFINQQLKVAARDNNVRAVLLRVNSPGGEVLAADEINRAIARYQNNTHRPVVASMGALAASGGYYVSAPCRWIVANELTITGSIGVIMHGYNYRGLLDKVGVRPEVYKSGKFKDMLSGDQEPDLNKLAPEDRQIRLQERQMVQDLIDETFAKFKSVVQKGRGEAAKENGDDANPLVNNWADYADGRVFSGRQAKDLGFVDQVGNFDDAVKAAKRIAKIDNASLIEYRQPFSLGSLFGLFSKTETPALKVDLGITGAALKAGYMYFIMPAAAK